MLLVLGASKPVTLAQEPTKEITNSNSHHIQIKANYGFGSYAFSRSLFSSFFSLLLFWFFSAD
jgi:hypothetical protein